MFELDGRTILVTGASKGIGAAIVETLGRAGAHVIGHYGGDRAGAEAAMAAIPADRRHLVQADLSDMAAVDRMWREALAWRGRIDVLVNNAATMPISGGFESDDAAWDKAWAETYAVNVLGPTRLMKRAVGHYLEEGGGILVTVSSWTAQRGPGNPDLVAYAASKSAVLTATKTVARSYADRGILAYVVSPGVVRTRLSEEAAERTGGADAVTATLAMKEWVPPAELGNLVAFLSSGACRHLSGATLDVNGASYIR